MLEDTDESGPEELQFDNEFLDSDDSDFLNDNLGKFEYDGNMNYLPPLIK